MVFTVFDLYTLICSEVPFQDWLKHQNLLLDFSSSSCVCGGNFVKYKDLAYSDGFCWRCSNRTCRKKFSVRAGSWFEDSKLSVSTILKLTYFWCNGYTNKLAAREAEVSENTVVDWFNYCREVCITVLEDTDFERIGGDGVVVEIDETKFGKRKYHRGKRVDGVWVFGGIESRDKSRCFFSVVENRTAETLIPLIRKHIRPGSIIISDLWKGYSSLSQLGYTHYTVNHSKEFKDAKTGAHTNHIETTWHQLKLVKKHSGFAKTLLSTYFSEFIFRRTFFADTQEPFFVFIREGINKVYKLDSALAGLRTKWGKGRKRGAKKSEAEGVEKKQQKVHATATSTAGEEEPPASTSSSSSDSSPSLSVTDAPSQQSLVLSMDLASDEEAPVFDLGFQLDPVGDGDRSREASDSEDSLAPFLSQL